jgi:hypothetical protein
MKRRTALGRNEIDILEKIDEDLCYDFGHWLESQYILFHLPYGVSPEVMVEAGYTVKTADELVPMFKTWMEAQ